MLSALFFLLVYLNVLTQNSDESARQNRDGSRKQSRQVTNVDRHKLFKTIIQRNQYTSVVFPFYRTENTGIELYLRFFFFPFFPRNGRIRYFHAGAGPLGAPQIPVPIPSPIPEKREGNN